MEVIYPRCAGLDVHKQTVVAWVRIAGRRWAAGARGSNVRDDDLGAVQTRTRKQFVRERISHVLRIDRVLETTMIQAAWAAIKVKGGLFHRLRARRGAKKAIIGVAASMLTAAWHMLRDGTEWRDLGAAHLDRADAHKTA